MADVARESGVSLSTVSMVFSDKPGLPAETRQRVLNTARALGYNLRRVQTNAAGTVRTITLLNKSQFNDIPRSDQFYSYVVAGTEAACRQRGINLVYATMNTDMDNRALEIPDLLEHGHIGGLLLVGAWLDTALVKLLNRRGISTVLVDSYCDCYNYDSVVSNNVGGAYQATEYLIQKGHRKIGFVGGFNQGFHSFRERRLGYQKALQDHQISEVFFANCYSKRENAIEVTHKLLLEHPDLTALVGANDFIAISMMHVANELGKRVGEDISLIGFDDIVLSESVIPPLTTMQVDKVAMGKAAVDLLIRRVENPDASTMTITIHPRLVERSSVKHLCSPLACGPALIVSASEG
jgi:LacI family transcriptional regulator